MFIPKLLTKGIDKNKVILFCDLYGPIMLSVLLLLVYYFFKQSLNVIR